MVMNKITKRTIDVGGAILAYVLEHKRVKNINMRVRSDGSVYVSAPLGVSGKYVDEVVLAHAAKLIKSQQKLQAKQARLEAHKQEGNFALRIAGQQVLLGEFAIPLCILKGPKPAISFRNGVITIVQPDITDEPQQYKLLDLVTKELIGYIFAQLVRAIWQQLVTYKVPYPQLKVRAMKSRWGSWNVPKHIMTLNSRLVFFPQSVIEYVIMHEFCHYFEANHSARFYAWLERLMPDWQERKRLLKAWAEGL